MTLTATTTQVAAAVRDLAQKMAAVNPESVDAELRQALNTLLVEIREVLDLAYAAARIRQSDG